MSQTVNPEARVGRRGEQKRRWDRENSTGKCACGRPRARSANRCQECIDLERREHRETVEALWAEGATTVEIRESLGIRSFSASAYRAHGYNLPRRITLGPGRWRWADERGDDAPK